MAEGPENDISILSSMKYRTRITELRKSLGGTKSLYEIKGPQTQCTRAGVPQNPKRVCLPLQVDSAT